ncbi:nuclear transport factor 2 family protein [Salinibacterium sp. ZJ454]|uniref:nuclear transport factor 2 family protein n=1 Tax=Salinibacterium sp. ZJ454 TaxID=2708339 RepID=UPI001420AB94|nr:nuclear transport factor 2 family protein [Salinibacterium sp. ZJ454]
MENHVQNMSETFEIRGVLERYCRAIDRLDRELLESCYWTDAEANYGAFTGPVRNFIEGAIPKLRERYEATMHVLGQSIIDIVGDRAYAETYCTGYMRGSDEGRSTLVSVGNRYVDVLERRAGEWRILDRKVIVEWSKLDADVTVTHPVENFPSAHRDESDPAYARQPVS